MGQPKVIFALVAAAALAVLSFLAGQTVLAVGIAVLGAGAAVLLLREGGATVSRPRRGRDDDFLEADEYDDDESASGFAPLAETPLSTWDGGSTDLGEPLTSWDAGAASDTPLASWDPASTDVAEPLATWESEPLATWDDSTDSAAAAVVDEAEEIAFASSLVSSPINEDVSTADEIMAASEATELHLGAADNGGGDGDDSELAKLLAKVQARLAAYE